MPERRHPLMEREKEVRRRGCPRLMDSSPRDGRAGGLDSCAGLSWRIESWISALSEEQQTWHDAAARFAAAELGDDVRGRDERGEFWREGYRRCARFGIQGLTVPEEFGGKGLDFPTAVAAMEGLGFGCPDTGLVFAINASLWTVTMPILAFGTDGPEAALAARALRRHPVRGQRRERAGGGLRHLRHADPRRAPRRRLGPQRPEDLDHRRPRGRPVPRLRHDRPRQGGAGHHRLPHPARDARLPRGARDRQAGDADRPDGGARSSRIARCRPRPCSAGRGAGRRSSTRPWSGNAGRSWRGSSARCGGRSSGASSRPGPASSSASRSASSRRSPTGSSTCGSGWRRAGRWSTGSPA